MALVSEVYEFGIKDGKADYRYLLENLLSILSIDGDHEFRLTKMKEYYNAEEWLIGESAYTGESYILNNHGIFKVIGFDANEQVPEMKEICNFYDIDKIYQLMDSLRKHHLRVLFNKKEPDIDPDDEIPFVDNPFAVDGPYGI